MMPKDTALSFEVRGLSDHNEIASRVAATASGSNFDFESLSCLLDPKAIAVVGASAMASKIGGAPVDYLLRHQFGGTIFPVNPSYSEVQGLPCFSTIEDVGKSIDLAIVAVPAAFVEQTIEQAIRAQVKSAVIFSSGFAEVGPDGNVMQERLREVARAGGLRLLGPNCLGFMNVAANCYATFSPVVGMGIARSGNVSIVSQSGAFGAFAYTLARQRGIGLSKWITTGNEADIQAAECVAWLANDPQTKVILLYLEGCRNGRALARALDMAREAGKPVVVTKVGRTERGAAAAASHTAALAGEDAVYDGFFRQHGAYRTYSIEEFFDAGYALSIAGASKGRRTGLITVSGGVGVLMADDASDNDLELPRTPAAVQAALKDIIPFGSGENPIDVTGQISNDPELLSKVINLVLREVNYDNLAVFTAASGLTRQGGLQLITAASAIKTIAPDTVVAFCSMFAPETREALERAGCLTFEEPSRAVRALSAVSFFSPVRGSLRDELEVRKSVALPNGPMNEIDALRTLHAAGIPTVSCALAADVLQAVSIAEQIGYPVALKIASPDILHKSDIGGVALKLRTPEEVREAFADVMRRAKSALPEATIDGVIVAKMAAVGVECILGVQNDPVFGPVVMFGLGGVFVETLRDVSFRVAPFDADEADKMIREIRAFPVLEGVRGAPPVDIKALARVISALSSFAVAAGDRLLSLDINPFMAARSDSTGCALDAVMLLAPGDEGASVPLKHPN